MKSHFRNLLRRFSALVLVLMLLLSNLPQARAADLDGAKNAIIQCYNSMAESADLTEYELTPDQLDDIFNSLKYSGQLPWYTNTYSYTWYSKTTGLVAEFTPKNYSETEYNRALYEQRIAEVMKLTVFPGMSAWQIALSVHDYLAAWNTYDMRWYTDKENTNYRGYDILVEGLAVCQGYSELYMDIMTRVGIPCRIVTSTEMSHAWNLIQIGSNWYHVDVTWDDPTEDQEGRVVHKYFLLSDETISDTDHGHYGWETDLKCTDKTFEDNVFWKDITSPILYAGVDNCYYLTRTDHTYSIFHRTGDGTTKKLLSYDAPVLNIGSGNYYYYTNGLSLYNGRLYFCDGQRVYSAKTDGTDKKTVHYHDASSKGTVLRGCYVEEGLLYVTYADKFAAETQQKFKLSDSEHTHTYTQKSTAANCVNLGTSTYTCSCGISCQVKDSPATGVHAYDKGTVTKQPTYTAAGVKKFTCSVCSHSYTESIPKLDPPPTTAPTVKPTTKPTTAPTTKPTTKPTTAPTTKPTDPTRPTFPTPPAQPTFPTDPTDPTVPTQPSNSDKLLQQLRESRREKVQLQTLGIIACVGIVLFIIARTRKR